MKRVHEWKEPWKKAEPNARLSNKQKVNFGKGVMERAAMESSTQRVKVIMEKNMFIKMGYFTSVHIKFSQPLSETEIMKRMSMAFPGLPVTMEEP